MFRDMLNEASVDKNLLKAIHNEFKSYGGPSNGNKIAEFMEKELNKALRVYFKTAQGKETAEMFADESGAEKGSAQYKSEVEYYEKELENSVEVTTKN